MRQSSPRGRHERPDDRQPTRALEGEYAATYAYGLIKARGFPVPHRFVPDKHSLPIGKRAMKCDSTLAALQAPVPPPAAAYNTDGPIDTPASRQLP